MLNILIVEDEPLFAETLRRLVELNPRNVVTERLRPGRPDNLRLYAEEQARDAARTPMPLAESRSVRTTVKERLADWWSAGLTSTG